VLPKQVHRCLPNVPRTTG